MKKLALILLSLILTSCAYTYKLTSDENTNPDLLATIGFSNIVKVSEIDNRPFDRKFSIWVQGSHEVTLPAGVHTFKFKYDARSLNGGWYTTDDTVLSKYLEGGKRYEITSTTLKNKIYFKIAESSELVAKREDK